MSFKIFSLQLLGKIKSVELIENQREEIRKDYDEFLQVENSEELQKYLELEKWVNSDDFKKKKAEIEALQFKGSKEFNQLEELKKLNKSGKLKKYYKVFGSVDLARYEKLKDSEKLKEYDQLLEYIKEGQFEKEKKEVKAEVFKGSVEEQHWLDFKRLDKSAGIKAFKELEGAQNLKKHEAFSTSDKLKTLVALRNEPNKDKEKLKKLKSLSRDSEIKTYFKYEKSKKLKLYHEMVDSHDLKKYKELKEYIENDDYKKREAYLKDKKKFEKSEAFSKYQKYKKLVADGEIKFFLKFEKSSLYKNYLDVKDSFDLKRRNELEEITKSKEFSERRLYLEDKKKWEKTDDFSKQKEYLRMKKLPHFIKYFKYKGTPAFDFFTKWEVAFEDDFSNATLDTEKWSNVSFIADKLLGDNYSLPGDLHVYNRGKNVHVDNKLTLSVIKEKAAGKIWQMSAGFIPVELEYTSDLVSSGKSFWQKDGIFEAKIKFNPVKEVVSSFYLAGENSTPRINLVEMGTKNNVGITTLNGSGKVDNKGLDISNLKSGHSYIFTIEKNDSTITWKINEAEVLSVQDSSMNFPLHLNASSLVVNEVPGSKLPQNFEIAWVKCYRKK